MEGRKGACLRAVWLLGDGIVGVVDGGSGNNNNNNDSERTFEAESAPLLLSFPEFFSFFFSREADAFTVAGGSMGWDHLDRITII